MASVRMSEQLRSNIERAAKTAFDTADPDPKPSTEFQQKLREGITQLPSQMFLRKVLSENLITGNSIDANAFVPKETPCSRIEVRRAVQQKGATSADSCLVELDAPLPVLIHNNRWSVHNISVALYLEELKPEHRYVLTEYFDKFLTTVAEHADRKNKYVHSIRRLLRSCTTLKQALTAWPALESFVPQEVMQTLHTKVTRVQKARQTKEEVQFDDALANQIVLTSKLMG